jgi:hypothetical protein
MLQLLRINVNRSIDAGIVNAPVLCVINAVEELSVPSLWVALLSMLSRG